MSSLYEIAAVYRADADRLADLDLDAQTVLDTLECLSGELESKAQSVVYVARNLEATAAAIKDAEAAMAKRRKAFESRAEELRRYVLATMQIARVERIECPHFRLSIRNNPPAVDIFEPALVPADYMAQPAPPPPAPDKALIKKAILDGYDVPGVRLAQGVRLHID